MASTTPDYPYQPDYPPAVTHPHDLLDCRDAPDFVDALHHALCSVDDWAGHGVLAVLETDTISPSVRIRLCRAACARAWLIALEHARKTSRVVPGWMHDAFTRDMLSDR